MTTRPVAQVLTSDLCMRSLGRFLQFLGLIILPLASLLQLSNEISVGVMLQMLAAGICVFIIGWILVTYR